MSGKRIFFQQKVETLLGAYERQEAEALVYRLIDAILGKSQPEFWVETEDAVIESAEVNQRFDTAIARLSKHEPIQYIIGYTYFHDLKIEVGPGVLIPRPETEELVTHIIEKEKPSRDLSILDIGTGSGCIAITLASNLKCKEVTAVDASNAALEISHKNAMSNNVAVNFQQMDILNDDLPTETYDIIVSNPPYVLESDKASMMSNVLDYEPDTALFVPDEDPLRFYSAIGEKGLAALKPGGRLYLEIHENFGAATKKLLEEQGYSEVKVRQDLFLSKDRMIFAKRG